MVIPPLAVKAKSLIRWIALDGRWGLFALWFLPVLGILWTAGGSPNWLELRLLRVTLAPGQALTLGRDTLQAPQADSEQLLLRRDMTGSWLLRNLSAGSPVWWRPAYEAQSRPIRQWPLTAGTSFTVGAHTVAVLAAEKNRLILRQGGWLWQYNGWHLQRDDRFLPECRQGWRDRLRGWLATVGLSLGLTRRPLRLGGGVYCADRLGLVDIPIDTAEIQPTGMGFSLRLGGAGQPDGPPVTVATGTAAAVPLWRHSVPLTAGDGLAVGRTQYRVLEAGSALLLAPVARIQRHLAGVQLPALPPTVSASWGGPAWLWPAEPWVSVQRFGWMGALLFGMIGLCYRRRLALRASERIAIGLALGSLCLGLYVQVLVVPILWPYLIAWPALLVWLHTVRSRWSLSLLAVLALLLGGGLITLLQLGAGVEESGWHRYGSSAAALAGAFGWLTWAGWQGRCYWLPPSGWLTERRFSWILGGLCAGSLGLLVTQVVVGDEGGWAGWQPFEFSQLVLVAAAARALTLRGRSPVHGWSYQRAVPWLHYLGPLGLLGAVCGFIFLFLHDFSPFMLLLFWGLALVWAYLRVHPLPLWRWFGQIAVISLACAFVWGLAWLQTRPETLSLDFQMDRIRVWAAPEQYPHAGYQLRRALEAIRAGGWTGTVWSEPANGRAMAVPVVESDFAPAFFLNRYGGLAGLILAGLQAMLVALLILIADRALGRDWPGGYRPGMFGGFAYFTLCSGAALLGAHFLISWGTNLGFLPVMGQPMSLLSAAGSHLVLFVLPIIALAVAAEEKKHDTDSH